MDPRCRWTPHKGSVCLSRPVTSAAVPVREGWLVGGAALEPHWSNTAEVSVSSSIFRGEGRRGGGGLYSTLSFRDPGCCSLGVLPSLTRGLQGSQGARGGRKRPRETERKRERINPTWPWGSTLLPSFLRPSQLLSSHCLRGPGKCSPARCPEEKRHGFS